MAHLFSSSSASSSSSSSSAAMHTAMDISPSPSASSLASSSSSSSSSTTATTTAATPTKKIIVIKNFKTPPTVPPNFVEDTWAKLQHAVRAIHQKEPISDSLEQLYRACENLCTQKMAADLFQRLRQECQAHVQRLRQLLAEHLGDELESFLNYTNEIWKDFCSQMIMIRSIFLFLDRTYVKQSTTLSSLWDMGLGLFRATVIESNVELAHKIVQGLLLLIEKERTKNTIDRGLVKNLIEMLLDLKIYDDMFEKPFLEATRTFYQVESDSMVSTMECSVYLRHCKQRLEEEDTRVLLYLKQDTRKQLIQNVDETFLSKAHTDILIEKGFDALCDENRVDDLRLMYQLFSKVGAANVMKEAFTLYVKQRGTSLISEGDERTATMVQELLVFKDRLDGILTSSFSHNDQFFQALKESFESFINKRQNLIAELIAKYIDGKLKSGNKESTDEELEATLDKVLVLFRYIQGKDIFEAFYKKDLAKRLLLSKSASEDAEKLMLTKLKTECGSIFTAKLEGMFKDMETSKMTMTSFRQSRAHQSLGGFELTVNVLTQSYWPTYPPSEINLPTNLAGALEVFRVFFLANHKGKKLRWQNSLGECTLKALFPLGTKELNVSLYQAVVLLLFNDDDGIKLATIQQTTNIEDKELRLILQSLACGKARVLTKVPKGKDVEDEDVFYLNKQFKNPLTRIKINQIQLKETKQEQEDTKERVFRDRQYQVDACIVRIMKTRKTISHINLMSELFSQLKFPMTSADLKKRIESLIDREYMERDAAQSGYRYVS